MAIFDKYNLTIERTDPIKFTGAVSRVQGLLIESTGPQVVLGELCQIEIQNSHAAVWAEVVGVHGKMVQLMPYTEVDGIEIGCPVVAMGESLSVPVSDKLLGSVLDQMGKPLDEKGFAGAVDWYSIYGEPPDVLKRSQIRQRMVTGIRSIDALCAVGKGQRLGIFSGSGVGKSTLLGMIARNTNADVNVIALIGERGREVREFIENDLGPEGLKRSVLVVARSNDPPLARLRGAYMATTIAEYFRDQGKDVMLLFDSVTRFARAQREIGLAIGEPPATRGYTPSVFYQLPKLLERCGTSNCGTITGFYTILVEGDDMDEPVSDAIRGILDGHIILSRRLAERYHYPAVDVLASLSRLGIKVTSAEEQKATGYFRRLLAVYTEAEDLINVGAYAKGSNPQIDEALSKIEEINEFLRQGMSEKAGIENTLWRLSKLSGIEIPGAVPDEPSGEEA